MKRVIHLQVTHDADSIIDAELIANQVRALLKRQAVQAATVAVIFDSQAGPS